MELTGSWRSAMPQSILDRYDFIETRNAAAILAATNPAEFAEVCAVLDEFVLTTADILVAGGNETGIASRLNHGLRSRGWREERAVSRISTYMQERGRRGTEGPVRAETISANEGYFIDNVKGKVVLDVEWNAKDGNLDRDLGTYRWLYEVGFIDVAVMVTREHLNLRELGKQLRLEAGQEEKIARKWLDTTTTTNTLKLIDRVRSGNTGGCPFLAVAITTRCWEPAGDTPSPPAGET